MALHPMSAVDAAWLHMDSAANSAVVTSIAIMRRPLDVQRVRRLLQRRLLHFDRFRQRVVERGLFIPSPAWEDVPVDLEAHVLHAALPEPGDEKTLRGFIEEVASRPLDRGRPLWEAHVLDNVGAGGAFVMRYHHCIGDGAAMMAVAARLFDAPARRPPSREGARDVPTIPESSLLEQSVLLASETGAVVADLLKWPDPASPVKGACGLSKRVAWSAPISLDDVKAIGAPGGAKVNDVLVAAIAGALRSYLRRRGVDVGRTRLRAMVPVNLRPPERLGLLGNEFGLVMLDLPVSEATPAGRLEATQARMSALKRSAEGPALRLVLDLFGRGPKALEDLASDLFGSKASLVLTNVAGPSRLLRLAGQPVDRLLFCVPHPGRQIGMGVSIFSYRGTITVTVIADAGLVPHPEAITDAFNREITALARVTARAPAARSRGRPDRSGAGSRAAARA